MSSQLRETVKFVTGLAPTTPATSTPDYVSLRHYGRLAIIIVADNGTTVTGSAITVLQATSVAGAGEKAVAFTKVYAQTNTANSDALTETAVVSNTFTVDATDNQNSLYIIEIDPTHLDLANGFDCVRAGTANATAQVVSVIYALYDAAHGSVPSAIVE